MYNIVIMNIRTIMSDNKEIIQHYHVFIIEQKIFFVCFYNTEAKSTKYDFSFVQLCVNVTVRMEVLILYLVYVPASKYGLETDMVLVIVEIIALGYVYIIIIYDLRQYHVTQL